MTPERWQQVEALVEAALQRTAGERAGFLVDACGADEELQRLAEALLASYDDSSSFLETPAAARFRVAREVGGRLKRTLAKPSRPAFPRPEVGPTRFGPYRILKTLGEGGMGSVYLAEQTEPIRRRVALKVIRPGMMRADSVRRFEVERQALARMNHPNIAQAYEAGETEDGQPYFVMEHVPGLPITRYCDEKRLAVRQRLELFLRVCDGVQHLHQKGVIHRDVKPSNVLVTEDCDRPVPKIIDFGIAKALDQPLTDGTVFTGERLIGTPSYLSPEAIRMTEGGLDVDTRSDVYALGVLLFELLTGGLPFGNDSGSGGFIDVARRITEEDSPLASARLASLESGERARRAATRRLDPQGLVRRLRGDLDWIVRKAMEKDRARRYGSAAELADDLRRHLEHEPVTASPPSAVYRLGKYLRRHRTAIVAAALVAVALVGGIVARTLEASRANREAARANEEAARANREAEAARQVSDFLVGLFEVSDPDKASSGEMTAREILDRGVEKLTDQELEGQPLLQARLMDTIGVVYLKLGILDSAAELLTGALATRRRHLSETHADVGASLNNVGKLYGSRGDYEQAEVFFEQALVNRKQSLGVQHDEVAWTLNNLGVANSHLGQFEESEQYFRQANAIKRRLLGADHPDVAVIANNLGTLLWQLGRYDEAEALHRETLGIWEQTLHPDHPRVAAALNNLAVVLFAQGRYTEAEAAHRRALGINEKSLGPDHPEVARALANLAETYWKLERYPESEQLYQRARSIWERSGEPHHPDLAHALLGLANLYRDQGRYLEAEPLYRKTLEIREPLLPTHHPELVQSLEDYSVHLRATGREAEAERLEARAAATRGVSSGSSRP